MDAQGKATFIDKEWQLVNPVEEPYLIFRSLIQLCGSITRFGRPASGENLTVYQLIQKSFNAVGITCNNADIARFESIEYEIQLAVSGIAMQTYFDKQKTRLLPMLSVCRLPLRLSLWLPI